MPEQPGAELLARLARLMEPYQLQAFIEAAEEAKAGGRGYFALTIHYKGGTLDEIQAAFTRKPRPDQSKLIR